MGGGCHAVPPMRRLPCIMPLALRNLTRQLRRLQVAPATCCTHDQMASTHLTPYTVICRCSATAAPAQLWRQRASTCAPDAPATLAPATVGWGGWMEYSRFGALLAATWGGSASWAPRGPRLCRAHAYSSTQPFRCGAVENKQAGRQIYMLNQCSIFSRPCT